MRADYHVHTEFSDDSDYAMEKVIQDSIAMGLDEIIILSVHEVEDKEFWTQDFQRGRTQKEYNERYYEELLYLVENYYNYSVLGHMDLITRYDKAGTYSFKKLKPILTKILKTVIADGKGIEVNTSSYRYGLSDLTPSRDILKLYWELGGHILTIGSDSINQNTSFVLPNLHKQSPHLYSILIRRKCLLYVLKISGCIIIKLMLIRSCLYARREHSPKVPSFVFSNYHIGFCRSHSARCATADAADFHNSRGRNAV